jgi:hypothetical protein
MSDNSIFAVRDASDSSRDDLNNTVCSVDVTLDVFGTRSFQFQSYLCYVLKCFGFALCVIGSESSYSCREAAKDLASELVSTAKCVTLTLLYGLHSIQHPLVVSLLPAQLIRPPDVLFPSLRTKNICRVTKNTSLTTSTAAAPFMTNVQSGLTFDELMKLSNTPVKQTSPLAPSTNRISSFCLPDNPVAPTIAEIWVFDGHSTHTLSTSEYGVFEVHHLYIIQVVRSSFARGGVHLHRLYFWIGPHLQQRVLAFAKIISVSKSVSNYIRKGGNNCSEIEISVLENFSLASHMCHKPACLESSLSRQISGSSDKFEFPIQGFANHDALMEFAALFKKGIFVVDKCSHPSYGLSMPSIALGCLSGKSVSSTICTLLKREVSSLHSLGNFCIIAPTCVLLWYGRWSDSVSRNVALDFVRNHFKNRLVRTCDEGSEPQEFFSYLEQSPIVEVHGEDSKSTVRSPKYLSTAPWWIPKAFACKLESGSLTVSHCASLEQHFFSWNSCMIVDAYTSVFVWAATCASELLISQCTSIAKQLVTSSPDRPACEVKIEHQHSESCMFRNLFVLWQHWQKVSSNNFVRACRYVLSLMFYSSFHLSRHNMSKHATLKK